jgi:oligopeptide/dipeptide ABC transporter ATP-binding protein
MPRLDGDPRARLESIQGNPPNPMQTDGAQRERSCSFAPRCTLAADRCRREKPALESIVVRDDEGARQAACFFARDAAEAPE